MLLYDDSGSRSHKHAATARQIRRLRFREMDEMGDLKIESGYAVLPSYFCRRCLRGGWRPVQIGSEGREMDEMRKQVGMSM